MTRAEKSLQLLVDLNQARYQRNTGKVWALEQMLTQHDHARGYCRGVRDSNVDAFQPLKRGQQYGKGWYNARAKKEQGF